MKHFDRHLHPGSVRFAGSNALPEPLFKAFPAFQRQLPDVQHSEVDLGAAAGADRHRVDFRQETGNEGGPESFVQGFFGEVPRVRLRVTLKLREVKANFWRENVAPEKLRK